MSVDRTVAAGEWGRSKIRCDGSTGGSRCNAQSVGGFRSGVKDARARAELAGWQVKVRTQYAPNGYDLRDYCPDHLRETAAN